MSNHIVPFADADRARHIAGLGTAAALDLIPGLRTPQGVQKARDLEERCQSRSAVMDALESRLSMLRYSARNRRRRA